MKEKVTTYAVNTSIPRSQESEMALLGAILINPQCMNFISIAPSDFYDEGNRIIYSSMRSIGSRDIDLVVLKEVLERKDKLDYVGGEAYLTQLISECPNSFNYEAYERIVHDTALRRRVITICENLARHSFDENKDVKNAISEAVSELVQSAKPKGGAVPMAEYMRVLLEEIEKRADDPKEIYGLATGIPDFDSITAGLQPGEEFILAGLPGTGKSLLAFQMACGMAKHGHSGAVYSEDTLWTGHQ